jgi:hypothetical protein
MQAGWRRLDTAPSIEAPKERWLHAMTYDAANQRVLMFGGQCKCNNALNDLWAFDGVRWTQIFTDGNTAGPSQRVNIGHAFVYHPESRQALLFGGGAATGPVSDTWLFDQNAWRSVAPAVSPPARFGHALAPMRDRKYVLWGGYPEDANTWLFDGTFWFSRPYQSTPPARYYHGMIQDTRRDAVILFGGASITAPATLLYSDTWRFTENEGWRRIITADAPSARYAYAMSYDATSGLVFVHGGSGLGNISYGDTWAFDGVNWREVRSSASPALRTGPAMAVDSARNQTVLYGGKPLTTSVDVNTVEPLSDTWLLSSSGVTRTVLLATALNNAPAPLREVEDNDGFDSATPLPMYRPISGVTDDARDVFAVTASPSATLQVQLSNLPAAADGRVQLQIYASDRVTSVGSDVSAPYELSVLNPQGVYYVVVFTDKANWTAASPYSLIARQ